MKIQINRAAVREMEQTATGDMEKRLLQVLYEAARQYEESGRQVEIWIRRMRDSLDSIQLRGECTSSVPDLAIELSKVMAKRVEHKIMFMSVAYALNLEVDESEL